MQNLFHGLAFLLVSAVALLLCVVQPFPFLHDYGEWMFQGWLLQEILSDTLHTDGEHAGGQLAGWQLAGWPVPNSLAQFALAALNTVVSPIAAGQLLLAAYCLFAAVICFLLSRHFWPDRAGYVNMILVCTIALGSGFWNGYVNNQFGLLLLGLFILLRSRQSAERQALLLLVFSLLLFFAHATVYLVFMLIVGFMILNGWMRRDWQLSSVVALLPSGLLALWYAVVKLSSGESDSQGFDGLVQFLAYKVYTVSKQGPFHYLLDSDGVGLLESNPVLYYAGCLLNGLLVVLISVWVFRTLWHVLKRQSVYSAGCERYPGAGLSVVIVATIAVLFLLPTQKTFGVVNLGERFWVAALLLAVLWYRWDRWLLALWSMVCLVGLAFTLVMLTTITLDERQRFAAAVSDSQPAMAILDEYRTRYQFYNHRLFIYAGRGQFLLSDRDLNHAPEPDDTLATGPLILHKP